MPTGENRTAMVYRDERYTLGQRDGEPYLTADGRTYRLSCHPYEPCLYITDENGLTTVVHNAFDPSFVIDAVSRGEPFTSITGRRYDAREFCTLAACAAGAGELNIDEAEEALCDLRRTPAEKDSAPDSYGQQSTPDAPEGCAVVTEDSFFDVIAAYPDAVIDFAIVRDSLPYRGLASHRRALTAACRALFAAEEDGGWHFEPDRARAKPVAAQEFFTAEGDADRLTCRRAFCCPPYEIQYTDGDFERVRAALFPNGAEDLELYEWTTDWSDYFDEGHEWWGALCATAYDPALDRFVVMLASASD